MTWIRRFLGSLIPHGVGKRWAYAVALVAGVLVGSRLSWLWAVSAVALVVGARYIDLRLRARRRIRLGLVRGYFFEGSDG